MDDSVIYPNAALLARCQTVMAAVGPTLPNVADDRISSWDAFLTGGEGYIGHLDVRDGT